MTNLVIIDFLGENPSLNSLATVTAAQKIGGEIHGLVIGADDILAQNASKIAGLSKLFFCKMGHNNPTAEKITAIVKPMAGQYSHILASANSYGKNFMPRLSALLDVQQISEITAVHSAQLFDRPIYAGNAIATVESAQSLNIITVRGTAFATAEMTGNAAISNVDNQSCNSESKFLRLDSVKSERPELTSAKIVVSGGRGMASKENFAIIEELAGSLNAAVGASRAAVDAGYAPNDYQVGQTGKVVAPNLYIAVGISGAIQHLAGMKDSKVIVAINKDPDAPIFQVADYGLVADLFQAVPALSAEIKK